MYHIELKKISLYVKCEIPMEITKLVVTVFTYFHVGRHQRRKEDIPEPPGVWTIFTPSLCIVQKQVDPTVVTQP